MRNQYPVNVFLKRKFHLFLIFLKSTSRLFGILAAMVVVITLFLYEAEPFNLSAWHVSYKLLKLSGYGFIYAGSIGVLVTFIKKDLIYPATLKWSSSLVLILILFTQIVLIGVVNLFYTSLINDSFQMNGFSLFQSIKHTFTFSMYPFLLFVIHLLLREKIIQVKPKNESEKHSVQFDKDQFIVEDIVSIHSDQNYITVYYFQHEDLVNKFMRYSLKEAENQLSAYSQFFRVHKSHVVNLNRVKSYIVKLNNMDLQFDSIHPEVRVGRQVQNKVKKWLNNGSGIVVS